MTDFKEGDHVIVTKNTPDNVIYKGSRATILKFVLRHQSGEYYYRDFPSTNYVFAKITHYADEKTGVLTPTTEQSDKLDIYGNEYYILKSRLKIYSWKERVMHNGKHK